MKCKNCASDDHKVMGTRQAQGNVIRLRKCNACFSRWQTVEIDSDQLSIMKSAVKAVNAFAELHKEIRHGAA